MKKTGNTSPGDEGARQRAVEPVRDDMRIASLGEGALSYDPATPEGEMLNLRVLTDPGVPAVQRDGWTGTVVNWGVGIWRVTDEATGDEIELPSLLLIPAHGQAVRLSGWPAISAWAMIVRAAGVERIRRGLRVRVSRRSSGATGRSYWSVMVCTDQMGGNSDG